VLVGGAETEVGRGIRVTAEVLRLAHGPIRDLVQAGAVAEAARQDVEVTSSMMSELIEGSPPAYP
jgi:hypothetical protein